MQKTVDLLHEEIPECEREALNEFYQSVAERAEGIDNAEGKQRIIYELYDKFFRTAFPKMSEQLGIVYTPVECVDFIINSVEDVLKKEFKQSLTDKDVHVIDPFTGTGTFMTRLLQSGHIKPADLKRKYTQEIIRDMRSMLDPKMSLVEIIPNEKNDWINQRDGLFDSLIPIEPVKKYDSQKKAPAFSSEGPVPLWLNLAAGCKYYRQNFFRIAIGCRMRWVKSNLGLREAQVGRFRPMRWTMEGVKRKLHLRNTP